MSQVITRADLHALVWAKPMAEVATDLGIKSAELERFCTTLDVPFPYSGYWRQAPRPSAPPRLRPPKAGMRLAIEITPALASLEAARSAVAQADETPALTSASPTKELRQPPTRLSQPHRIIAARLEEERRSRAAFPQWSRSRPSPREAQISQRRLVIENLVFKALEARGHKVEVDPRSLYSVRFVIHGQEVTYGLRERYTNKRRALSAEEARRPENVLAGRTQTQERLMTGELVFAGRASSVWPNPEWRDRPNAPLELQVSTIVEGLEALARKSVAIEAERREEERRYAQQQARREELARQQRQEANRWRRLIELATQAEEVARVRRFVAQVRLAIDPAGEDAQQVAEWLDQVERQADAIDPLIRGPKIVMGEVRRVGPDVTP